MSATSTVERVVERTVVRAAVPRAVQRLRLALVCAGLTALIFAQSAGSVAPDTKLDLIVDPMRFLRRTLTLWDPQGAAGQLQNQAYGYLFPMGPFFAGGKLIALPAWVIQRGWQSALVVAAFLGVVRLARLLSTTAFWPRVGAGLVYALAPRMLSELGSISSELMPMAVLPWLLIPLVQGASRGSPRRAAARSGVALLFAGGVNAAATVAILPVPALWLLTRRRSRRRRHLLCWWLLAVALACLWWAIPLVLLGKYSPPFLDWIESSSITTGVTSMIASLRGADHWQAYLGSGVWPAGWIIVAAPATILATAAVAAAGIAGLARRDVPQRVFLRSCLVVGLVLVTAGYAARVGPPFGSPVRTLLDGPLNAFRNIHKFDPVIRLPIALGFGHLLARLNVPDRVLVRPLRRRLELRLKPLALLLVLGVGAVAISPVIANRLVPQPRTVVDASWWRQAGAWLGAHEGTGRALVVPGAAHPVYFWGSTVDDALQPVTSGAWTVRDGVPLAQPAYVRLLDDISQRFAAGRRDGVLAALLARSGVRYVVVRNDLDTVASGATGLAFVHTTLADSPGFAPAAAFGPAPALTADRRQVVDLGATSPRHSVEIYDVAGWSSEVGLLPASGAVTASGSADDLGNLLGDGIGPDTPVLFGADARASGLSGTRSVLTDGVRRREARFGLGGSYSATMTAGEPYSQTRAAHDYLPADPGALSTIAYGGGLSDVTASSSGADTGALLNVSPGHGAWAAVDGNPSTSWESSALTGAVGQWLQVSLDRPISASTVQIAFTGGLAGYPSRVQVRTDSASRVSDVAPGPVPQALGLPAGPTRTLRITVLDAPDAVHSVGISTLSIPGVSPTRTLVVPGSSAPDVLAFNTELGGRGDCLTLDGRAACDPSFGATGEEDGLLDRTFTLSAARQYAIHATVTPRTGLALNALLDAGQPIRAVASSVDDPDPRERPGAAVDANPRTSWVAGVGDQQPSLTLDLGHLRRVSSLGLQVDPGAPIARPTQVRVTAAGHAWSLRVPSTGVVRLPRTVLARTVRVTVTRAELRSTNNSVSGTSHLLPAGISEVTIDQIANTPPSGTVALGCASGLAVNFDGVAIPMQAKALRVALLAGRPISATACGAIPARLQPGTHRIVLAATPIVTPQSITLSPTGTTVPSPGSAGTATPMRWSATERTVRVSTTSQALLVVHENANAGWQASLHGHRLESVRLDGWQQGWVVPAGAAGVVTLTYAPQSTFDVGLLVGLLGVLVLIALLLVPHRAQRDPPVDERPVPPGWLVAGSAVAAFLLGGVAGLAVAAVVYAAVRAFGRAVPYWSGAIAVGLAGCAEAYAPAGTRHALAGSPVVQALCVAAVCLMLVGGGSGRRQGREKRRSRGRSKQYQDSVPSSVDAAAVSRKNSA